MNEVDLELSSWKKFHLTIYLSILTDERDSTRKSLISSCVEELGIKGKHKVEENLWKKWGKKQTRILIMQE